MLCGNVITTNWTEGSLLYISAKGSGPKAVRLRDSWLYSFLEVQIWFQSMLSWTRCTRSSMTLDQHLLTSRDKTCKIVLQTSAKLTDCSYNYICLLKQITYSYNSDIKQLTSLCQKFAYGSKSLLSGIVQRGVTIQSNFTKISTISCQNSNHFKVPIQSCPMKKKNK